MEIIKEHMVAWVVNLKKKHIVITCIIRIVISDYDLSSQSKETKEIFD